MDIARSSRFTILYGGRSLLSPSYFLLRWTRIDTDTPTYCICTNIGNEDGPILLEVTETGAVTPDPFDAEVQLASGNHQLDVWEQTSDTNLFPPNETPDFSELVNVSPADLPAPPYVDPCLGCGDGPCVLCDVVGPADPEDVVECVTSGNVPALVAAAILRDEATPEVIVVAMDAADKTDEVRDLICTPCGDVEIIDQDDNVIATPACGTQYSVLVFDGIDGGVSNTVFTNSIVAP